MPTLQMAAPLPLYIPIERFEETEDGLIVEGRCFVNPKAGDGWDLTRAAMEEATADYEQWGCVREMHDKHKAAGKSLGVTWDETGCILRALIVDSEAIKKIRTKVYKGFSVGVAALQAQGKKILRCLWKEVSLVDRPQDKDALLFEFARSENDSAIMCEMLDPEAVPDFEIVRRALEDDSTLTILRRAFNGFYAEQNAESVTRFATLETSLAAAKTELTGKIDPLIERVEQIAKTPQAVKLPILNPQAVERRIAEGQVPGADETGPVVQLERRYNELNLVIPKTPDDGDRQKLISERAVVRMNLAGYGVHVP